MNGTTPPLTFFQGVTVSNWRSNEAYRVYVLPGELVFICVGGSASFEAGAIFGVVGALVAKAAGSSNIQRLEQIDVAGLYQLVSADKRHFRAPANDLFQVRLDPPSYWLKAMNNLPLMWGVLRFTHQELGKKTLCICSLDDMKIAFGKLPQALGLKLEVNVEWSEKKRMFVGNG